MLTPQQEAFAAGVARGLSQAEAYRQAYPKSQSWKDASVWNRASALMRTAEVLARVEQLRAELEQLHLWSREDSVRALKGVIEEPDKASDVVAAVRELNAMHGFNAPEQMEVTHKGLPGRVELVAATTPVKEGAKE
jgi:hypothetical protein